MSICFFLMATSAAEKVRRKNYELFWYTHHLFIVAFSFFLFHGAFCFVKADEIPYCPYGGDIWMYGVFGGTLYSIERLYREYSGRKETKISKVILHPGKVMEVRVVKPSIRIKSGQYIWINCPKVSVFQWHPFTLTSCPHEKFISVHIRIVGDWTTDFAKCCGALKDKVKEQDLPLVMIDGPKGAASEDWMQYKVILCVGAGIGVTPFASILKSIFYARTSEEKSKIHVQKVYFVWICRETNSVQWFQSLLFGIEKKCPQLIDIRIHHTGKLSADEVANIQIINASKVGGDAISKLKSRSFFGRPDWDKVFTEIRDKHINQKIGVFFCGPKPLSKTLHEMSNKYTDTNKVTFHYNKGTFFLTFQKTFDLNKYACPDRIKWIFCYSIHHIHNF